MYSGHIFLYIVYEKDKYSGTFFQNDREIFKILALSEHLSPEKLQMIVDGKLKDGDKVLVETSKVVSGDRHNNLLQWNIIKFNSSNYITLYPIKERIYTREEMEYSFNAGRQRIKHPDFDYVYDNFEDFINLVK